MKRFFRGAVKRQAGKQNALAAELFGPDKSNAVDDLDDIISGAGTPPKSANAVVLNLFFLK